MKIVIATQKSWNIRNANEYKRKSPEGTVYILTNERELTADTLGAIQPEYVFFPHWSSIIPPEIYENYKCIVFHMTDLPFGRGGSPLQNLIARGCTDTMISAIRVERGIDAGAVYLKEPLSLIGSAEEIYLRASEIIFCKMIPYIIKNKPMATAQVGEITAFSRRTPEMSELSPSMTIAQIFDYIRMLDAEGYPKAFIKFGEHTLRFSRAKRTYGGIIADVEIVDNTRGDSAGND